MRNLFVIIILIIIVVINFSCKKERDEKQANANTTVDPCKGYGATSANFTMKVALEAIPAFDGVERKFYETDTILAGETVYFRSNGWINLHNWKVGLDERTWTEKEFKLRFSTPGEVDVRLIGTQVKVNKECFPDDDGVDTVIRKLVILPNINDGNGHSLFFGQFEGANLDEPEKKFTVTIRMDTVKSGGNIYINPGIYNLPYGCTYSWKYDFHISYYGFRVGDASTYDREKNTYGMYGWGELDASRQQLKIDYEMYDPKDNQPITRIKRTFVGIRK